jgi:hypothetical protein
MALPIAGDICGLEVSDRSLIDDSCRDLSRGDKIAGPLRRVAIVVVVEGSRQRFLEHERAAIDAKEAGRRAAIAHVDRKITRDHGLGRARRGGQSAGSQLRDLPRLERARRDFAQNVGDNIERAHDRPPAQKGHNQWPPARRQPNEDSHSDVSSGTAATTRTPMTPSYEDTVCSRPHGPSSPMPEQRTTSCAF